MLSQFSDVRIGKHQVIEKLSIMEMRNPVMLILQDRRLFLHSALACNQRFVGCDDIFWGKCQNISSSSPAMFLNVWLEQDYLSLVLENCT